jgi:(1->4)-alpha-D-glucan 1-alpha-D-glucosylmutase
VLSELPEEWSERVTAWSRILRAREAGSEISEPPARNDEYAFYQLLLAAWPPELVADADSIDAFRLRIEAAMTKSIREAKVFTSWASPNAEYEDAVIGFVRRALDSSRSNPFLNSFSEFLAKIAPLGVWNSLLQTVLKLTVPGVPDIYQGAELWDFALVDPDNRRPVDFDRRRDMLCRIGHDGPHLRKADYSALMRNWHDGAIKLRLIANVLEMRKNHPKLFQKGSYEPIEADGQGADRVCAFVRRHNGTALLIAGLRFPLRGMEGIAKTTIPLPTGVELRCWNSLFDARTPHTSNGAIAATKLFHTIPIAAWIAT